jgi:glycosyltransferase involved in cell wall biosynthesis
MAKIKFRLPKNYVWIPLFVAIVLVILLVAIFNVGTCQFEKNNLSLVEGFENKSEIKSVKRPFVNFYDNYGNRLNIIGISKPFTDDNHEKEYNELVSSGCIIIGVSSYLEFPNSVSSPFENFDDNYNKYKYKEKCKAWLHGFRNPENYFPPNIPNALISESDFIDCAINKPDPSVEKIYDFIYICLKQDEKKNVCDDWATYNKNWDLAKKCLKVMCEKYKLKGLLVGRKDCEIPNLCHKLMDSTNMLKHDELKKSYQQSKFIFLPNYADASPRVLCEAMATGLPALINRNILGGWKYINQNTGVFFTDENDIDFAINDMNNKLLRNDFKVREEYINNYGPVNSGRRLRDFLYDKFDNQINVPRHKTDYVTIDFAKSNYAQCEL